MITGFSVTTLSGIIEPSTPRDLPSAPALFFLSFIESCGVPLSPNIGCRRAAVLWRLPAQSRLARLERGLQRGEAGLERERQDDGGADGYSKTSGEDPQAEDRARFIDCNASGAICGRYQGYALAAWSEAPGLCGARTMRRAFDERLKKLPGAPHKPKPTPRFEYTFNSAILGGMDDPNAPPEVNVAELRTAAERQLRANAKTDPEARAALQRLIQKGRLRDIGRRVLSGLAGVKSAHCP